MTPYLCVCYICNTIIYFFPIHFDSFYHPSILNECASMSLPFKFNASIIIYSICFFSRSLLIFHAVPHAHTRSPHVLHLNKNLVFFKQDKKKTHSLEIGISNIYERLRWSNSYRFCDECINLLGLKLIRFYIR